MTDTPRNAEVADYEAAVRRHLAGLPAAVREDLLADLETHLTEVAADLEPGVTLVDRLGTPAAYASELREAAEVDGAPSETPPGQRFAAAMARAGGLADRYTVSAGAGSFAEFWKSLKPGWWVLRGVAAAGLVFYALMAFLGFYLSFPAALVVLVVLSLAGIWCSLRFAARSANWRTRGRWALTIGGIALVWLAAASFFSVYDNVYSMTGSSSEGYYEEYSWVQDVYPYTEDGELLTDVYLFDQDGAPLNLGDPSQCAVLDEDPFDENTVEDPFGEFETEGSFGDSNAGQSYDYDDQYGYQYPLCVADGDEPTSDPSETPTIDDATETPTDDATESPTADETTSSETPTPAESTSE